MLIKKNKTFVIFFTVFICMRGISFGMWRAAGYKKPPSGGKQETVRVSGQLPLGPVYRRSSIGRTGGMERSLPASPRSDFIVALKRAKGRFGKISLFEQTVKKIRGELNEDPNSSLYQERKTVLLEILNMTYETLTQNGLSDLREIFDSKSGPKTYRDLWRERLSAAGVESTLAVRTPVEVGPSSEEAGEKKIHEKVLPRIQPTVIKNGEVILGEKDLAIATVKDEEWSNRDLETRMIDVCKLQGKEPVGEGLEEEPATPEAEELEVIKKANQQAIKDSVLRVVRILGFTVTGSDARKVYERKASTLIEFLESEGGKELFEGKDSGAREKLLVALRVVMPGVVTVKDSLPAALGCLKTKLIGLAGVLVHATAS